MVGGTSVTCILQMKRPGEEFAQGHTGVCVAGRQVIDKVESTCNMLLLPSPTAHHPYLGNVPRTFIYTIVGKSPRHQKAVSFCPAQHWCLESGRGDRKCPDVFLLGARQPHRAGLPEYSCGCSCVSWHKIQHLLFFKNQILEMG